MLSLHSKKNYVQPAINTSGGAWNIMQMMMLHHKSTWRRSRNQQETFSGCPATTSNFHRWQTAFAAGGPSTQCSSGDEAQLTSECGVALATGTRAIQPRRIGFSFNLPRCFSIAQQRARLLIETMVDIKGKMQKRQLDSMCLHVLAGTFCWRSKWRRGIFLTLWCWNFSLFSRLWRCYSK